MVTVYIIYLEMLDRYYTGMCKNMSVRLKKHRTGQTPSLPASSDWVIVWSNEEHNYASGRLLEKKIKARGAERFLKERGVF